jgi:hypothetical protein
MNESLENGGTPRPHFARLRLKNFDVSWAGQHPFMPGFCFGSEDGRLLFTDEDGSQIGEPFGGSYSRDAINGLVRSGEWIAVSTRQDVTLQSLTRATNKKPGIVVFPHGAHGVTATPSGYFVAPLGRTGIMLLKPGSGPSDPVWVIPSDRPNMHFYRVLALQGRNGKDLLVCAGRQGGIGSMEARWGQETYNMRVATFDGLDVVDVCAVDDEREVPAVAALTRDGTLILIRDALHDEKPATLRFNTIQGTAYRLLRSGEHLLVLTSRGLYVLAKLADRLVTGMPPDEFVTQILTIPMEAVDANVVNGRWLLIIMPDGVQRVDVNVLCKGQAEAQGVLPTTLTPVWHMHSVSQRSSQLAAV